MKIRSIVNEDQYNDYLARLVMGARYIESDEFSKLPLDKQKKAYQRYDELTKQILIYQKMEWAISK